MEVAGEGREGLGSQRERKPRSVALASPEGIPGSWTGVRLCTWLAVACAAPGGRPGMAHLLLRWHGVCSSCHFPLPSPHPRGLVLPWLPPNLAGSHLTLWLSGA